MRSLLSSSAWSGVVNHIQELGHGGTLLVVPDTLQCDDPRLVDRLRVKFPCRNQRIWGELVSGLVISQRFLELDQEGIYDARSDMHYIKVRALREDVEENEHRLSDGLKFVAGLTGVDGAVLMTDHFRLLGFGCEVTIESRSLNTVRIARDVSGQSGDTVPIEQYGTRHRSAFRFCSSYEDAVAFVISQDGGVKAVMRCGPDLVMWPDINLASE